MNVDTTTTALVTGANRGIGRAIALELADRGVKVYAAARDARAIDDPRLVPVALDVTDSAAVHAAARELGDVSLVINNAGIDTRTTPLDDDALESARRELEVNYLAPLDVTRAFAPVLAANGGGALVNVLSVMSFVTLPGSATYAASKAAGWSLTNGLRVMLRGQGTQVVGVHFGYVETDMTAGVEAPKLAPADVARTVVDGIVAGSEEVLADEFTQGVKSVLHDDLKQLYPNIQRQWDGAAAAA
jgi:NAD(P)-dependent dehydrogenase (short-subunit alcohol dehydrogenase family)